MITVCVLLLRARMLLGIEPDIEVVAEANNGLEAVHQIARFQPSVVLMDIRMSLMGWRRRDD